MKNRIAKILFVFFTAFTLLCSSSCNSQNDENRVKSSDDLLAGIQKSSDAPVYNFRETTSQPEEYTAYSGKCCELSLNMIMQDSYYKENTVFAPLSVSLTLSAFANGTSQKSLSEIKNIVGKQNYNTEAINKCSSYISQRIRFLNTENTGVFNVCSMWVSDKLSPKRSFLQKYDNFYDIYAYRTDFGKSNVNTIISNLISDNSKSLLPTGDIMTKKDYRIYMDCSAAVSDVWLSSYSENDISKGKFNAYGGKSTDVTYIASLERSFKTNSAKGFVKDLKNTPCKMFFILPDKNYSLEDYVKSLTYDKLVSMPESVSPTEFSNVSIPEFSVSKNVSLKNTLENLGVKRIFSKEADISKGFAEDVYVDDITQSVSVTVNHSGVSAGEDTPSDNSLKNKNDVQPKVKDTIIFDRPFIYAVVDNESYIPIIIGTVNNPK